jgi:hypothetical protein
MNRSKSFIGAIGAAIIMGLLVACGAAEDVPMLADMKQIGVNANAGSELGELANNSLLGSVFTTAGTFNWNKTSWESTKSLDEVRAFYSQEGLAAAGWNAPDMPPCVEDETGAQICLTAKASGDTYTVLLVSIVPQSDNVQVVIIRIEGMKKVAS